MNNNFGIVRILPTADQTLLVATDGFNNLIVWDSANFDKRTASTLNYDISRNIAIKLKEVGIDNVDIIVRGSGLGKRPAIKALRDSGIIIKSIRDVTPIPHHGCVSPKELRKVQKSTK